MKGNDLFNKKTPSNKDPIMMVIRRKAIESCKWESQIFKVRDFRVQFSLSFITVENIDQKILHIDVHFIDIKTIATTKLCFQIGTFSITKSFSFTFKSPIASFNFNELTQDHVFNLSSTPTNFILKVNIEFPQTSRRLSNDRITVPIQPQDPAKADKAIRRFKLETGYVGLRNQGSTCYLDSMTQALYHIPAFRRLVFEIPTAGLIPTTCVPLALQRLFALLQISEIPPSTVELTTSFGWTSQDVHLQHDAQEYERVLLTNIENYLKDSELLSTFDSLFKGTIQSYIRCINVPFEKTKNEDFFDITLSIPESYQALDRSNDTNNLSLDVLLKEFITPEKLEGDNQYQTEEYGKQDVLMGNKFISLPSVLFLHIARFHFNYIKNRPEKNNSRIEFPEILDMSPYLDEDVTQTLAPIYELRGVLVHSGGTSSGHYYAFIRPGPRSLDDLIKDGQNINEQFDDNNNNISNNISNNNNSNNNNSNNNNSNNNNSNNNNSNNNSNNNNSNNNGKTEKINHNDGIEANNNDTDQKMNSSGWFKFNDTSVSYSTKEEAIQDNFGGEGRYGSAYLLVYLRCAESERLLDPISSSELPQHLLEYVKSEEEKDTEKKAELQSIHINISSEKILYENSLQNKIGFSFLSDNNNLYTFPKDITSHQIYEKFNNDPEYLERFKLNFNLELNSNDNDNEKNILQLWITDYQNHPTILLNDDDKELWKVSDYSRKLNIFALWIREEEEKQMKANNDLQIVFIKFFFKGEENNLKVPIVRFLGHSFISSKSSLNSLIPFIKASLKISEEMNDNDFIVWNEFQTQPPKKLSLSLPFYKQSIGNASILVFQFSHIHIQSNQLKFENCIKLNTISNNSSSKNAHSTKEIIPAVEGLKKVDIDFDIIDSYEKFISSTEQRLKVEIFDKNTEKPLCLLTFPNTIEWDIIKQKIAEEAKFNYDPNQHSIALFENPETFINTEENRVFRRFIGSPSTRGLEHFRLYYEILDLSEEILKSSRRYIVMFNGKEYESFAPLRTTSRTIFENSKIHINQIQNLSFWSVRNRRIIEPINPDSEFSADFLFISNEFTQNEIDSTFKNENNKCEKKTLILRGGWAEKKQYTFTMNNVPFLIEVNEHDTLETLGSKLGKKSNELQIGTISGEIGNYIKPNIEIFPFLTPNSYLFIVTKTHSNSVIIYN